MSENDGKASPANGGEVNNPGGYGQGRLTSSDPAKDVVSASGAGPSNVPDNTAEPASEPCGNQSEPATTDEAATPQENDTSTADSNTASSPRPARLDENAGARRQSALAIQVENPGAWFPSAGAESLRYALSDDIAAASQQTGAVRESFQKRGYADNSAAGDDAEIISPLDLSHGPGVGASSPELHEGGPRPGDRDSSPEDTAYVLGEEDKGLRKVSDLISRAVPGPGFGSNPRPLPPIPHAPGVTIAETQPDTAAPPRGTSTSPQPSRDWASKTTTAAATTDDRDTLPSAVMRRPGEAGPAPMLDDGIPAPLRIPGRRQAAEEARGAQEIREPPSEDPWPQAEPQSPITIHTPIPTRPVQFNILRTPEYAPEPLMSNPPYQRTPPPLMSSPPYPCTPPPQRQYQAWSPETVTPTQGHQSFGPIPTLRAYEVEPPRHGRGFDHRRAPAAPPGTSERTHLFVPPQFLPGRGAEHARIIAAYNAAFDATSDATKTLLSKRHRYPGYTRDDAARLRKLEFEAATGESMSEDAYYALFDLETANDGMISALLEWMQGRTWIKVPFVNRIIHQVCRLMFTSAQEEARLRLRFQRDCDLLRDEVDAADENIALERMQNSWQRIDAAVKKQYLFVTGSSDEFRAPPDVRHKCNLDASHWDALSQRFTSLMRTRQDIEDTIRRKGEVMKEDLGQLEMVYGDLENNSGETSIYMGIRKEKTEDPERFPSTNRLVLDFARRLNEDVYTEEEVRYVTTAKFLETATRRLRLRARNAFTMDQDVEDLPSPSIPVFASPQMLDSREIRPEAQDMSPVPSGDPRAEDPEDGGPGLFRPFYGRPASSPIPSTASPSQVPAYPPADPFPTQAGQPDAETRPNFSNPWQEARLIRPRGSCTRCQALESELKTKLKDVEEARRVNQARSVEMEKLEGIVRAIDDKDMETAFKHMDGYRDVVRTELRQALQFILSMLEVHGRRAHDQANILEISLRFWQAGGSLENVMTELHPMARSVRRLASAVDDVGSQLSGQLEKVNEKVDAETEGRLRLLDEDSSQRRLIESLQGEIESLKTQKQRDLEAHTTERLEFAKTMQQQMQAESDRLKEQIRDCQSQLKNLRNKHEGRDPDSPQTADSSIQDLNDKLERKEAELSELESQNRALEEQLATTTEKIEALSKAKEERDKQVKSLEEHVRNLQIKLEAKAEAAKWSWKPHQHAGDPSFGGQHSDRVSRLRTELMEALGRVGSRPWQKFDTEARKLLPGLAQSVLWPRKPSAAGRAPGEDLKTFWRLAAFSRMRSEVVATLERRDFEGASERLDRLQAWNAEMGPWQTEAQGAEVLRTINFLRSHANFELGKMEGFGTASSERLEAARALFDQAVSSDGTGTQISWDSFKEHLGHRLDHGEDELVCECEYKPRICAKHRRCGGARYHNFMEEDDNDAQQAEIELTQEAYSSLRCHAFDL